MQTHTALDLVGNTPLVALPRMGAGLGVSVLAKCEQLNPGGSIKDRLAVAIVEDAEASGRLRPGMTIIEATAGNTGIGLALVLGAPAARDSISETELLFLVASHLACLRPERIACVLLPNPEALASVVHAARALAAGDSPDGDSGSVPALFAGLPRIVLEQIAAIGRQLDPGDAKPAAALAWLRAVDATAARAGLALTGDLSASARALRIDASTALSSSSDRIAALAWSSITDELAQVGAYLDQAPPAARTRSRSRPAMAVQAAAGVIGR